MRYLTSENRVVPTDVARIAGAFRWTRPVSMSPGPVSIARVTPSSYISAIASAHWTVCDALCARASRTSVLRDTARADLLLM